MIEACALLHQAQRPRDQDGQVLATYTDYDLVRDLMAEEFATTQQDGLTPAQRQAVEAVIQLQAASGAETVSVLEVAKKLGIDRSSAQRRLSGAARCGYVRNLETRSRQPAAYAKGEDLPEPRTFLPTAQELRNKDDTEPH
jgi:IclR-like helix-turn-helix domain-containing protein